MRQLPNTELWVDATDELKQEYAMCTRTEQREIVEGIYDYADRTYGLSEGYEGTPEYADATQWMRESIEDELADEKQPDSEPYETKQELKSAIADFDFDFDFDEVYKGMNLFCFIEEE